MINPLYTVILNHRDALPQGGASIQSKQNKQRENYFLLPLAGVINELTIADDLYTLTENHLTIFQSPPSARVGHNSASHLRLTLKDKHDKNFKIYLYFDDQGKLTVQPMLIPLDTAETPTPLHSQVVEMLYFKGSDACCSLLSKLSTLAQQHYAELLAQDQAHDKEMATLNITSHLSEQERFAELSQERIRLLTLAEQYSTTKIPVLIFLKKLQQRLHTVAASISSDTEDASDPSKLPVIITKAQLNHLPHTLRPKKSKRQSKGKKPTKLLEFPDEQAAFSAMLDCIVTTIPHLESPVPEKEKGALFKKLGNLIFNEGLPFYQASHDQSLRESFELMRLRLISEATRYCQTLDSQQLLAFLPILQQAHLLTHTRLPESLLLQVIKDDNAEHLQRLLNNSSYNFFEQAIYTVNDHAYTLLEWTVFHNAVNCYKVLLTHGFSPFYMSGAHSPIAAMDLDFGQIHPSVRSKLGKF